MKWINDLKNIASKNSIFLRKLNIIIAILGNNNAYFFQYRACFSHHENSHTQTNTLNATFDLCNTIYHLKRSGGWSCLQYVIVEFDCISGETVGWVEDLFSWTECTHTFESSSRDCKSDEIAEECTLLSGFTETCSWLVML